MVVLPPLPRHRKWLHPVLPQPVQGTSSLSLFSNVPTGTGRQLLFCCFCNMEWQNKLTSYIAASSLCYGTLNPSFLIEWRVVPSPTRRMAKTTLFHTNTLFLVQGTFSEQVVSLFEQVVLRFLASKQCCMHAATSTSHNGTHYTSSAWYFTKLQILIHLKSFVSRL